MATRRMDAVYMAGSAVSESRSSRWGRRVCCAHTVRPLVLAELFERFWEQQSRLDPLAATAQGDNRFNDQLPNDQTEEFRQGLERFYEDSLRQLQAFDRTKLTDADRISYDIFAYEMKQRIG